MGLAQVLWPTVGVRNSNGRSNSSRWAAQQLQPMRKRHGQALTAWVRMREYGFILRGIVQKDAETNVHKHLRTHNRIRGTAGSSDTRLLL